MREYIFHGKRIDCDEWAEGHLGYNKTRKQYYIMDDVDAFPIPVHKESVGEWTGMNEFVASDKSRNRLLFEGDIIEVWSNRSPKYTRIAKSQYDGDVIVRATICFRRGSWTLDYDNKYNEELAKLRGKEEDERTVDPYWELYHFGCHYNDEEWEREHNAHYKWHDIVKIGTVFENADLLEG